MSNEVDGFDVKRIADSLEGLDRRLGDVDGFLRAFMVDFDKLADAFERIADVYVARFEGGGKEIE